MNNQSSEFPILISKLQDALIIDDKVTASIYLKKLAEIGRSQRYVDIAILYELGNERLRPRLDLAFEWYSKSAYEEIDYQGYFGLARFYFSGKHVKRDLVQAVKLFRAAFDMGSVEAGVMLGHCYFNGLGVESNLDEAEKFLLVPFKADYVVAVFFLSRIEYRRKNYFRALKLWIKCIAKIRELVIREPESPKLFYLHGARKLQQ